MRSVRISDNAYEFLNLLAQQDRRSIVSTLDLLIDIFKEAEKHGQLESTGISSTTKKLQPYKRVVKNKANNFNKR